MAISTAVDASAVARVVGIKTEFNDLRAGAITLLPQRIAVIGQGSSTSVYSVDKARYTSAFEVGTAYGFGSPLHLASLQLLPANGDGVGTIPVTFYPLEDDGAGVAASGTITPSGAATGSAAFRVKVNGLESVQFVLANGDTIAAITAKVTAAISSVLELPVLATDNGADVTVTAKWAGVSGNDLNIEVIETSENLSGVTFVAVQPSGGLVDPDIQPALDQIGTVWETLVLNCFNDDNVDALDALQTTGEGRWGALIRKPYVAFVGNTDVDVNDAIVLPDTRKTDRINAQLVAPGSKELPLVIAARQLARIAVIANNNPARDYGSLEATNIEGGKDSEQWTYPQRDQAVKGGSSTTEVKDGVITLGDIVTFYHPTGDTIPAYRYVVDIVKVMNIIFNLDLIFVSPEWDGAPLIPDNQPTVNRDARQPKAAVAAVAAMVDNLALEAILSNPDQIKATIQAAINSQNPKRLDIKATYQISGNVNIISKDLCFGFFFGVTPLVAQ